MNRLQTLVRESGLPAPCLFYPAARAKALPMQTLLTDASAQAELLVSIAREYPVSAVVRMTELWCEAAAFGMDCTFPEDDFPKLGAPLYAQADSMARVCAPGAVNPVTAPLIEAVRLAASRLELPLIVGVTGPYTLGSVLGGSEDFMVNCMMEPELAEGFLTALTDFLISYILEYKKAGADAVMIAEPSVSMISPAMTEDYSNVYLERIISAVQDDTFRVIYHNCGDVNRHLSVISQLPAAGFHFGSAVDLSAALSAIPTDRLVMGNVEPQLFLGEDVEAIAAQACQARAKAAGAANFVLSTGCDLSPRANARCIEAFLR